MSLIGNSSYKSDRIWMQRKNWLCLMLVFLVSFSYISLVNGAVIFQDDFEYGLGNWETFNASLPNSDVGLTDSTPPNFGWPFSVNSPSCPGSFSACNGPNNHYVYFHRNGDNTPWLYMNFSTKGYTNVKIKYLEQTHINFMPFGSDLECLDSPLLMYRFGNNESWRVFLGSEIILTSCVIPGLNDFAWKQIGPYWSPLDEIGNHDEVQLAFKFSSNDGGLLDSGDDFFIDDFQLLGDPISCSLNSDCGTNGYVGNSFCSTKNVVRNYTSFTCNNPGTEGSYCSNSVSQQIISICSDYCLSGACGTFICHNNSECNDNNSSTEDICINPNTLSSFCQHNVASIINCSVNTDCGVNGFSSSLFCIGNNIKQNYTSFTCNNPGTTNSYCSNSTSVNQNNTCADTCSNGQCFSFICHNNSECNDNNSSTEDICINPNTINSICAHNIIPPCQDDDGDSVCNINDLCPNTPSNEDVDLVGCSLMQFCEKQPICGIGCNLADWKNNEQSALNPHDCITVLVAKEGKYYPKCASYVGATCGN
ncbi:MAG TPA: hypothetical protein P5277_04420 [Candidatus Paceibacterota bacterium]|nr:hypothetical protein [Candidatus Paceibacterota bacterium]